MPEATTLSAGHAAAEPEQFSATSQPPGTAARHSNVAFLKASAGQPLSEPSQTSAVSHGPEAGRHTVPISLAGLVHVPVAGLHVPASWQSLLAAQVTGLAPTHAPAVHVSTWVHASPSSQTVVSATGVYSHAPEVGLHETVLHAFGAHAVGDPALQLPPLQLSLLVHALPSEHDAPSLPATETQFFTGSHVSTVHGLPSPQSLSVGVPAQMPAAHVSLCVQDTSSLQLAVLNVGTQPIAGSHVSSVQGKPSLQVNALPLHKPFAHASASVQALLSVQVAPSLPAVAVQPIAGSQASAVQGFSSLQVLVVPVQIWPTHVSETVHALLSSQPVPASASACAQPTLVVQLSIEQGLLSSHGSMPVGTQLPPEHVSPVVQGSPSVQAMVLSWWKQPVVSSQASAVQNLLSSQFSAGPPMQLVLAQVSFVVHLLPSSHAAVLGKWTQPEPSKHESLVQTLPSSQPSTLPEQMPPEHVSLMLHTWPSLHALPLSLAKTQPSVLVGSQLSAVQSLLSLHGFGVAPTQLPPPQMSPNVHAFLSSHSLVLFVKTQPVAGTQVSVVQTLSSVHGGMVAPLQTPWPHASSLVQALLSVQVPVTFVCTQPLAGLQLSDVQTLLSSQLSGLVMHAPVTQVSPVVHASPSLHVAPSSLVYWQPPVLSQISVVHGLLSLHCTAVNWVQPLFLHVSPAVHASPSLHVTALAKYTQPPLVSLHELSVHGLLSSQLSTAPRQTACAHVSLVLHALPSSHASPSASMWTQPLPGSQLSVVHALLSLQSTLGPAVQSGPTQVSLLVQALLSSHVTTVSAWIQPVSVLQLSAVHALPSSQFSAKPGWQLPSTHVSLAVQALPSEQPPVSGFTTQPFVLSQDSVVHGLSSVQTTVVPVQVPVAQLSSLVQASPSLHEPV